MGKSVDRERKYNFCNWINERLFEWKSNYRWGKSSDVEYNQIIYGKISFFNEIILRK